MTGKGLWLSGKLVLEAMHGPSDLASLPPGIFPKESLEKPDLVIISQYPWHGMEHRPHHEARRLAQRRRVLYVRPRFVKQEVAGGHIAPERLEVVSTNLVNYEPFLLSGEDLLAPVRWLNQRLFRGKLEAALAKLGVKQPVLWYNNPKRFHIIDDIPHDQVVYEILDEYRAFSWAGEAYKAYEEAMFQRADVVFAGTEAIAKRVRPLHKHCLFLPCGVDYAHFHKACDPSHPLPPELTGLQGKVLGYFGAVDDRLDQDLLLGLVQREEDWHVVIIGPKLADMSRLEAHSRIHVLGLRPYGSLPDYCRRFDVCLIPFVKNEVTQHINPTKLLEYFAARKPVVTISIPDVLQFYGNLVYTGDGLDAFHLQVKAALSADTARLDEGEALAKERSWESFVEIVENAMNTKG